MRFFPPADSRLLRRPVSCYPGPLYRPRPPRQRPSAPRPLCHHRYDQWPDRRASLREGGADTVANFVGLATGRSLRPFTGATTRGPISPVRRHHVPPRSSRAS